MRTGSPLLKAQANPYRKFESHPLRHCHFGPGFSASDQRLKSPGIAAIFKGWSEPRSV